MMNKMYTFNLPEIKMEKQFYTTLFVLAILLELVSCRSPQGNNHDTASRTPNIIYIYADDLGYAELGCYGQKKIKTPNLDQLAAEGIRFTQHYTSTPVCAPARCMLMTGQHAGNSYIRGNYSLGGGYSHLDGGQMPLPESTYTLGHLMQDAGYVTGAIGKWGLGSFGTTGEPLKQGFDYFYGYLGQGQAHSYYPTHLRENNTWDTLENDFFIPHVKINKNASTEDFQKFLGKDYAPDKMTEKAINFIDENKEKAFFLYLPYTIPHASLQIPRDSEAYKKYEGRFDTLAYYGDRGYTPHPQPRAAYAGMITQLDMYVGQIRQKIKELGLDENTVIMFSSDNGTTFNGGVQAAFFNSTGGLRGLKMDLYEGGIRMPFIARWPGHIPAGKVTDHISAQYDVMATLADLLGVKPPSNDGISMLPVLLGRDNEQKKHEFLYFEYPEKDGQVAIRIGDWKGVKIGLKSNPDIAWELYNLASDVSESNNVAAQHPEILTRLDSILKQEHEPAHIREWEFVDRRFAGRK
jgi:arylsulfatase A